MIKILYISSIPVLIILVLILALIQFNYKAPSISQEMTRITDTLVRNSAFPDRDTKENGSTQKPPVPSEIWTNNIFDSTRALTATGSGGSASPTSLKDTSLIGVFGDGNTGGAVILISNLPGAPSQPSYGGNPSSYINSGSNAQNKQVPPKQKMVFLVGEKLPNGFVLKSVTKDSAVLQGGDGTVTLNMTFADENSEKRLVEAQKIGVKQEAKIIETGKQGAGGNSSGGTNTSNVIIRNVPDVKQN